MINLVFEVMGNPASLMTNEAGWQDSPEQSRSVLTEL